MQIWETREDFPEVLKSVPSFDSCTSEVLQHTIVYLFSQAILHKHTQFIICCQVGGWVGGRVKQKQLSTSQAQIKSLATIVVDRDMLFLVGRHRVLVFSLLTSCLNLDFDLIFLKEEARVEKIF